MRQHFRGHYNCFNCALRPGSSVADALTSMNGVGLDAAP